MKNKIIENTQKHAHEQKNSTMDANYSKFNAYKVYVNNARTQIKNEERVLEK